MRRSAHGSLRQICPPSAPGIWTPSWCSSCGSWWRRGRRIWPTGPSHALTIIYRNRKDYQQLQALFEENPHFAGHPSYHHLLILFQLEAETFFDALELLELAREDARQHRDNAGYLHLFAHLFVYTCEKSRGEMREQVRREYYDDVERAVEDAIRLDPAYAKFYCTKARVVAQRGRYAEAYSLINKAVATGELRPGGLRPAAAGLSPLPDG